MGDFNAKVAKDSQRPRRPIEDVGRSILDAAYKIHSFLGPGLLEGSYELCLAYELGRLGLSVRRQVLIPIQYASLRIDSGYRSI
jgi:GxxExxY protein